MTARPKIARDIFALPAPSEAERAACHIRCVQVSLFEIEDCGDGAPWQAWPEVPCRLIEREVNGWLKDMAGVRIVGAATFCKKQPGKVGCVGVTIYHHGLLAADPPRASSGSTSPAGQGLAGSPVTQPVPEQCRIGGCGE